MMESIEKLREYTQDMRKRSVTPGHNPCADAVDGYLDEIEREIAERFMELPVDADGVPIRVGDELYSGEVIAFGGLAEGGVVFVHRGFEDGNYILEAFASNVTHHVKPRTVEDVLREFAYKVCDLNIADCDVERYADELRELLGVDR